MNSEQAIRDAELQRSEPRTEPDEVPCGRTAWDKAGPCNESVFAHKTVILPSVRTWAVCPRDWKRIEDELLEVLGDADTYTPTDARPDDE